MMWNDTTLKIRFRKNMNDDRHIMSTFEGNGEKFLKIWPKQGKILCVTKNVPSSKCSILITIIHMQYICNLKIRPMMSFIQKYFSDEIPKICVMKWKYRPLGFDYIIWIYVQYISWESMHIGK